VSVDFTAWCGPNRRSTGNRAGEHGAGHVKLDRQFVARWNRDWQATAVFDEKLDVFAADTRCEPNPGCVLRTRCADEQRGCDG
jgi:hypothetical protein